MNFSFNIITNYTDQPQTLNRIQKTIKSIEKNYIDGLSWEVIVIGGQGDLGIKSDKISIKRAFFDETQKEKPWITKKKNVGASLSLYENMVVMHDYYEFDDNWYTNLLKHKEDFLSADIVSCPIKTNENKPFYLDWITWDLPNYGSHKNLLYRDWSRTKHQYVSGGFFIVKKEFFKKHPLDESRLWGDMEDVEWSLRVRDFAKIICLPESIVRMNKTHRDNKVEYKSIIGLYSKEELLGNQIIRGQEN